VNSRRVTHVKSELASNKDEVYAGDESLRREKTSVSQEDYLKAIWEMLEEDQTPISARLAEELKVTPPAVTAALKRMTRDGHVRVERTGRIDLTRKGRSVAERLALRHQLAEMLLTEVIGLSWAKAHDEAERLEHGISPEVESLLLKRFGNKKSCPHGVPMRGGVAKLRSQGAVLLSDLRADERAEILCVYEKDAQFLEFLEGLRLRPSTKVEVLKREYDETMTLRADGHTMHLGKPATSRIWVRRLEE
jgi:DtxR family Mn-dependent transcriptional regulator